MLLWVFLEDIFLLVETIHRLYPVPKYTKMAIVYSHFGILGHRARHKLISGEGVQPPQNPLHYPLYSALCCSIRNVYTQGQASPFLFDVLVSRRFACLVTYYI